MRPAFFAFLATAAPACRGSSYGAVDLAGATHHQTSFQEKFQNEVNDIIASAAKYGSAFIDLVVGISVGGEDGYRITNRGIADSAGISPQVIADYANQVRSAPRRSSLQGKPIGHVDTYNTFVNSSSWMVPIIEAVDFIGLNAFPYFEDTKPNGIDNGNATLWADYDAVVVQAGSK